MKKIRNIGLKFATLAAAVELFFYAFVARAQDSVQTGLGRVRGEFPQTGLTSSSSVLTLIISIIKLMLTFAGVVAVLFVIIGGFWYITSAGNEEQAEKGKNTVVNAIIGVVVIILSYTIITVIINTVNNCTGGFMCF